MPQGHAYSMPEHLPSHSETVISSAFDALAGKRKGVLAYLPFIGPALIASIAYMDPGNFATNVEAGAKLNMKLLWVVMMANIIAMLFQALSAKLGLATHKSLAENCRLVFPKYIVIPMWILSECAAMATDLAEFLGAALGISLISHQPLIDGLIITAIVTWIVLHFASTQFRIMEYIIAGFILIIGTSYMIELVIVRPQWPDVVKGFIPTSFNTHESIMLAVGIIGATVMPHALYLHSNLTQNRIIPRSVNERRQLISFSNREIMIALSIAGLINLAMVIMAASVFHPEHADVADITTAYQTLTPLLGAGAGGLFLIALIASGLSSSIVGTLAGQSIMQDFVQFTIPLWVRRFMTMAPSFIIVYLGYSVSDALIMSQVALSLLLPLPMFSLVWLTSHKSIMGEHANSRLIIALSVIASVIIISLNLLLLASLMG
jgi:manganese transport protein